MQQLIAQQVHTENVRRNAFRGCTLWLTGFSCAGKTTIATYLKQYLNQHNVPSYLLDGDVIRQGLSSDLGFSNNDRSENIRRIAEVSRLMADSGTVCIVAFISPFKKDRQFARQLHDVAALRFFEIYVNTDIETCKQRDDKGLYAKAAAGEISGLTGIDSPYDIPECPDVITNTVDFQTVEQSAQPIIDLMRAHSIIVKPDVRLQHDGGVQNDNNNNDNQSSSSEDDSEIPNNNGQQTKVPMKRKNKSKGKGKKKGKKKGRR